MKDKDKMKKGGLYDGAGSEDEKPEVIFRYTKKNPHTPIDANTGEVLLGKNKKESEEEEDDEARDAMQRLASTLKEVAKKRNAEETAALFGEEFKGYKGQAAIDKLMKEKHGHIKAAFHRDDIGDIDLLWGNDYVGLQHILIRREEQGIDVASFVNCISEAIEKGGIYNITPRGDFVILHGGVKVLVAAGYHGIKRTYVLTAYKCSN